MAGKKKVLAKVREQKEIAAGIYDLWLETELAEYAVCGQFVGVYPKDKSHLLPRPVSICEINERKDSLRLVYRVQKEGTREFSRQKEGDEIFLLGNLGNGFPLQEGKGKRALLMGGGIGIPPMLQLAKELDAKKSIVLGYRNKELFLKEEFEAFGNVFTATEDGSKGIKGNVMDVVEQYKLPAEVIYACGPLPMLKAIREYAAREGIPAYISLEERMACGVGACLGCVCRTAKIHPHSQVNNARICTEGPVFLAEDVII